MSDPHLVVYVIDDNEPMRKALTSLIASVGLGVKVFASPDEYLKFKQPNTQRCLVLDVRLEGKNGLELQRELAEGELKIPIIFLTGHGDIQMSVQAMKAGAIDFLAKPFRDQDLLDAIQIGLERDRARYLSASESGGIRAVKPNPRFLLPRVHDPGIEHSFPRVAPQVVRARSADSIEGTVLRNELLANLPDEERQMVFPKLTFVDLRTHDVLNESGVAIKYAYFLNSGLASILNVMEDGHSVEVGVSGREGFIGVALLAGFQSSASRVIVQVGGSAFRVGAMHLVHLVRDCPVLRARLQRYVQIVGLQSAQVAACNRLHQVEQRLARWLLMCQDRIGSEFVPLTQEFLANMLGTRRSSVTVAAGILQKAGLIAYTPGHVTILDRARLESASCECYGAIVQQESKWNQESA